MILYYALGGGLGHIARSLALIAQAPEALRGRIRLLVSSRSAEAARPACPCPMDNVPAKAMATARNYSLFLDSHIKAHRFSGMILDTFPFGLLGEWADKAPELPRFMVGRYLRWDEYKQRVGRLSAAVWPRFSIMIEEQNEEYMAAISSHSLIAQCDAPLSLARPENISFPEDRPSWCVVHSGAAEELDALITSARNLMAERGICGNAEVITPSREIFPLEQNLAGYSDIVSGAGYASCAASKVLEGSVRYHLQPFLRRYDDQELRIQRLRDGRWGVAREDAGGVHAGTLLWDEVRGVLN